MSRLDKAIEFRNKILANVQATQSLIRVDELSDEQLETMVNLYSSYEVGVFYKEHEIFKYKGKLYKVVEGQSHTSEENWIPSELPALYTPLLPESVIGNWTRPLGGHDAYKEGEHVIYKGLVYKSTMEGNVWNPEELPTAWELVEEVIEEPEDPIIEPEDPEEPEEPIVDPEDPEEPEEPVEDPENPEELIEEPEDWVKPTGGHDAYKTGDEVLFEGNVYKSIIDNNTWSPTDYPQGWELITP